MSGRFLPGVPGPEIEAIFAAAPGNEIATGKFDNLESSAALAANAFGFFLNRASDLPALPGCEGESWPARSLALEAEIRFPWSGGRHPVLDCLVETPSALIGIESKRFEPYRSKQASRLSDTYWRPVWGENMAGYESIRNSLRSDARLYAHLDALQLFKHAFALRTEVHRPNGHPGLTPILFCLYAEPGHWPANRRPQQPWLVTKRCSFRVRTGTARPLRALDLSAIESCCGKARCLTAKNVSPRYMRLLDAWTNSKNGDIRAHAVAIR